MSPGTLKKPLLKLNRMVGHTSAKNHMSKPTIGDIKVLNDEHQQKQVKEAQQEQVNKIKQDDEKRSHELKREEGEEVARAEDPPEIRSRYGTITANALGRSHETPLASLTSSSVNGGPISFTTRIHHVRAMSPKLVFVVFRQQIDTIQGVLEYHENEISENFVRWALHLAPEGLVRVEGRLQLPQEPVTGSTIHDIEVRIESLHLIVPVMDRLPVDVYNIDRVGENEESHEVEYVASNRVRLANRISFLRTPTAQSIFRINSGICSIFRSTLEKKGFIEIHTPKLQPTATESGAEVFKANYFGRKAFLAQSPQLAKQLCISADFGRVFEIGSVFRAENSNTHRHLTEYTSLDLEMVINTHYYEAMDLIDELLKSIFKGIYEHYCKEIDIVKTHFPHDDLVWLDKTPRISFTEAVELLNSSGWTDDKGNKASDQEDLGTRAEIRLGELVKDKYKTDYYILDKFPASARPFYTQLDSEDERFTNSFDIFLRGQEITTGGQRIHDPRVLAGRMQQAGIDSADMEEYMQGFEWGVLPHAGCGIGLERVLFLFLNLRDVRNATLFPRDPKSLPEKKKGRHQGLPHPDADTIRYSFEFEQAGGAARELPSIEKLIANYGDATNTSCLDDRYQVWRHESTGAAVGFAEENGYALVMGNPLCDHRQYQVVIAAFLRELRKTKDLMPLWILVSAEVEEILGAKLGWRTFTTVAEERVEVDSAKKVAKKERQAEDAGVTIHELGLGGPVPDELRRRCDKRIEDWKARRTGTQVHITEVRPWVDTDHRRYLWAEDKDGEIAALVVLHRLSPEYGYQIKFALDFPGAPSGSIESLISRSIQSLAKSGVKSVTFGAGATPELAVGHNLHGMRAKILSHTYRAIAQQLNVLQKSEFREKFGTQDDPVYICYPTTKMGVSGARTLIKFFEGEM